MFEVTKLNKMKSQIKQPIQITLMIVIFSLISISCRKNNPAIVDTVKPKFTFYISGLHITKTFYSDSSYTNDDINLPFNTTYNFTIITSDASGLREFWMRMPKSLTFSGITSTPVFTRTNSSISQTYRMSSESNNPYVSMVISGQFTTRSSLTQGDLGDFDSFEMSAIDYRPNQTLLGMNLNTLSDPVDDFGYINN